MAFFHLVLQREQIALLVQQFTHRGHQAGARANMLTTKRDPILHRGLPGRSGEPVAQLSQGGVNLPQRQLVFLPLLQRENPGQHLDHLGHESHAVVLSDHAATLRRTARLNWNRQALVSASHDLRAVSGFQAFHDEVSEGHVLEMIHEEHVDQCSPGRADHRHRFGRGLLRHDHAKARSDGRDQPQDGRSCFLDDTLFREVSRCFGHRFSQRGAHRPVSAFRGLIQVRFAAQGKNFQAGHFGLWRAEVVAFAASNVGNGPQHDGRRDRQFHRQRSQAEGAANSTRSADQQLVELLRSVLLAPIGDRRHGGTQRGQQSGPGGFVDHGLPAARQQQETLLDGFAHDSRQARGQTGILQQPLGSSQFVQLRRSQRSQYWRQFHVRFEYGPNRKYGHADFLTTRWPPLTFLIPHSQSSTIFVLCRPWATNSTNSPLSSNRSPCPTCGSRKPSPSCAKAEMWSCRRPPAPARRSFLSCGPTRARIAARPSIRSPRAPWPTTNWRNGAPAAGMWALPPATWPRSWMLPFSSPRWKRKKTDSLRATARRCWSWMNTKCSPTRNGG